MMKLPRRRFLQLAAGAAMLPSTARLGWAEGYPTRPIRWVVGFPPGGSTDIVARIIAPWLSERLGQQVIVENKPGAGTNLAAQAVVNAPPDGHTLLFVTPVNAINATLYGRLSFDFIRDIAPIAGIVSVPFMLVVNPAVPAKTVAELIDYAKANPGKVSMCSAGVGSVPHMAGELFKLMADVDMLHVPYRGSAPALTDLIAGHVQVMFDAMPASLPLVRSGALRALAVTTSARLGTLPDLATVAETVPGLRDELLVWHWGAEGYALRNHRAIKSRNCRGTGKRERQRTDRRSECCTDASHSRTVWQAHRCRNGEVGQSRSRGRYQGGLKRYG